ncbi:MAG: hypothetical protein RLZZ76_258 [Candidatus Parcubacteria bacterium]
MTTSKLFQFLKQQRKRSTFKKGDRVRRKSDGEVFDVEVVTKYGLILEDQFGKFPVEQFVLVTE